MPTISAIVPTYNRCAYLVEALEAITSQTRPVEQIIVWDDGSTDATETCVRSLASDPAGPILYRRSENRGKSRALNAALSEATGDFIWICDDDDVALPHAAERLGQALETSHAGMSAGMHDRFRDNPETGARMYMGPGYWPDLSTGSVLRHLLEDVFFFQNATLVRREALDRVGPFQEDLQRSIDYEMFVRLAARYPVEMVGEVLFHQRKHDGARGPAAGRHAEAQVEAVWLESDRAIFAQFRDTLPIRLYEAFFETGDPMLRRRAALLQRACVYARRNDWAAALEDLEGAADIDAAGPLTATERAIGIRTMAGKHGVAAALRSPVAEQFVALGRRGRMGSEIAAAVAQGAVWRVREAVEKRAFAEAVRIGAFIARVGGRAALKSGAQDQDARLQERRTLGEDDYAW